MSDSPRGVGHTDSMDSNDLGPKQPDKKKSRRPASECTRWSARQQCAALGMAEDNVLTTSR
jgi:hypothetical protein